MEVTGTVSYIRRRVSKYGSVFMTVTVGKCTFRYLQTWQAIPLPGDTVTITGVPMVGYKRVNVGSVKVTINQRNHRPKGN